MNRFVYQYQKITFEIIIISFHTNNLNNLKTRYNNFPVLIVYLIPSRYILGYKWIWAGVLYFTIVAVMGVITLEPRFFVSEKKHKFTDHISILSIKQQKSEIQIANKTVIRITVKFDSYLHLIQYFFLWSTRWRISTKWIQSLFLYIPL